ncbi:MAG TPA: iron-sulfur cluster assembly protein, partial [Afifellaceae bacterium]|nr:iron-sulfur cluster assembly protein [Afifellaceae bacterium]
MTAEISKDQIIEALRRVKSPDLKSDIISQDLVSDIYVSGGKVIFSITVPAEQAKDLEPLRQAAEQVVSGLPGVQSAMV